jgi:hypothetical protein
MTRVIINMFLHLFSALVMERYRSGPFQGHQVVMKLDKKQSVFFSNFTHKFSPPRMSFLKQNI